MQFLYQLFCHRVALHVVKQSKIQIGVIEQISNLLSFKRSYNSLWAMLENHAHAWRSKLKVRN